MSATCPTCHSHLSCGCQKRTASNGVTVCTMCITRYEAELAAKKHATGSSITPLNALTPNTQQH